MDKISIVVALDRREVGVSAVDDGTIRLEMPATGSDCSVEVSARRVVIVPSVVLPARELAEKVERMLGDAEEEADTSREASIRSVVEANRAAEARDLGIKAAQESADAATRAVEAAEKATAPKKAARPKSPPRNRRRK